jgi:hypothetical protein
MNTNAVAGWALAVAAIAVGYATYGWPGVALGITAVVFWLLLQFNRALRAMRRASGRPVGSVDNAVMLHARLHAGMTLLQILPVTKSLGQKVADDPETFVWTDGGGDSVRVELRGGRCSAVTLQRAADGNDGGAQAAP